MLTLLWITTKKVFKSLCCTKEIVREIVCVCVCVISSSPHTHTQFKWKKSSWKDFKKGKDALRSGACGRLEEKNLWSSDHYLKSGGHQHSSRITCDYCSLVVILTLLTFFIQKRVANSGDDKITSPATRASESYACVSNWMAISRLY